MLPGARRVLVRPAHTLHRRLAGQREFWPPRAAKPGQCPPDRPGSGRNWPGLTGNRSNTNDIRLTMSGILLNATSIRTMPGRNRPSMTGIRYKLNSIRPNVASICAIAGGVCAGLDGHKGP